MHITQNNPPSAALLPQEVVAAREEIPIISPFFEKKECVVFTTSSELFGLRFGVKSIIDVQDCARSVGSREWDKKVGKIATYHAPLVQKILEAGAKCLGTLHSSAFCFDLSGQNDYGMPLNFAAKDRVPGGSSAGCAAAVADGSVDFAIGTDTGGSIRIPAAYCGIWSIRPTFGAISTKGVLDVGPATDTVGIMASKAKVLDQVAHVALDQMKPEMQAKKFIAIKEMFALCSENNQKLFQDSVKAITKVMPVETLSIDDILGENGSLAGLQNASRLMIEDTWNTWGPWLDANIPNWQQLQGAVTPEVCQNFGLAKHTAAEFLANFKLKESLKNSIQVFHNKLTHKLRTEEAVIIMPTVPFGAPSKKEPLTPDQVMSMITLTSLSSLLGLPQVQMPLLWSEDLLPLGVSIIGLKGEDLALTNLATRIESQVCLATSSHQIQR